MLSKLRLISTTLSVIVFIISVLLAPYYNAGDQLGYSLAYEKIGELELIDAYVLYVGMFGGTTELVHFIFSWICSSLGIQKNISMASANSLLVYLFMTICIKHNVSVWVSLFIILSNYYFFGLYFAAERLKFGAIFFIISLLVMKDANRFILFSIISILSHVQTLIVYASQLLVATAKYVKRRINFNYIIIFTMISYFIYKYFGYYLVEKFVTYREYNEGIGFESFLRLILFVVLSMNYERRRIIVFLSFLPLIISVYFVGPDRINMLGYFLFLYYALQYNRGINLGVLLTTLYFGIKGLSFVVEFMEKGHGFGVFITFPGRILF